MSYAHRMHWDFDPETNDYLLPADTEDEPRCVGCGELLLEGIEAVTLDDRPVCGPCRDRLAEDDDG